MSTSIRSARDMVTPGMATTHEDGSSNRGEPAFGEAPVRLHRRARELLDHKRPARELGA